MALWSRGGRWGPRADGATQARAESSDGGRWWAWRGAWRARQACARGREGARAAGQAPWGAPGWCHDDYDYDDGGVRTAGCDQDYDGHDYDDFDDPPEAEAWAQGRWRTYG